MEQEQQERQEIQRNPLFLNNNNNNNNNHNNDHPDINIVSGSDNNNNNNDDNEEEDSFSNYESSDSEYGNEEEVNTKYEGGANKNESDVPQEKESCEFYNPNLDDEDEAWVYKHKRGGLEEPVSILHSNKDESDKNNNENSSRRFSSASKVLKPRASDAILSCPCCFEIVCMDCQRHERYSNQFRAMFVMNIGVSWDTTICPENMRQQDGDNRLDEFTNSSSNNNNRGLNTIPTNENAKASSDGEIYYSVYCNNCHTVVAALNMKDEVYHFFGCLTSG